MHGVALANPAHRAREDRSLTRKATTRHAAMATSAVKTVNEKPVARSQVSCQLAPTSCRCNAAAGAQPTGNIQHIFGGCRQVAHVVVLGSGRSGVGLWR